MGMCEILLFNIRMKEYNNDNDFVAASIRRFSPEHQTDNLSKYSTTFCAASESCVQCIAGDTHAACGICVPPWTRCCPTIPILIKHIFESHPEECAFDELSADLITRIDNLARSSHFIDFTCVLLALVMNLQQELSRYVFVYNTNIYYYK